MPRRGRVPSANTGDSARRAGAWPSALCGPGVHSHDPRCPRQTSGGRARDTVPATGQERVTPSAGRGHLTQRLVEATDRVFSDPYLFLLFLVFVGLALAVVAAVVYGLAGRGGRAQD